MAADTREAISFSSEIAGGTYLNQYQNTIVSESNSPVDAFQTISNSKSLQNNLLGSESDLSSESRSRLYKGLIGKANEKIGMATGRALLTIEAVVSGAASLNAVGRLGVGLLSRGAAKASASVVEEVAVHGNSLKSFKPTWGYKLFSEDGTFLKNGITSKLVPETRYTKAFMQGKYMEAIPFPNRAAAYEWEFMQNTIQRGPLNLNMY
ncbi:hypothetical protein [uncultured Bacteroides sp.]|uniref:hypothetical protein n=1 Tax=uncultured Bacteroides sp. TaxID=162156 RepID=UPI002AA69A0E|nr:hypothetical protein [uncultured Bacteroides sp.]